MRTAFPSIVGHVGVRYRRLLKILIESGGMYCLTWLILLCLNVTNSPALMQDGECVGIIALNMEDATLRASTASTCTRWPLQLAGMDGHTLVVPYGSHILGYRCD